MSCVHWRTRFKVSSFKLWYVVSSIKINHVLLNLFKIAINRDSYKSLRRTFKSLHLLKSSSKTTKNFNCQSWIKLQGLQKLQRLQSIEVSWAASSEVLKKLSPQIFEDEKQTSTTIFRRWKTYIKSIQRIHKEWEVSNKCIGIDSS